MTIFLYAKDWIHCGFFSRRLALTSILPWGKVEVFHFHLQGWRHKCFPCYFHLPWNKSSLTFFLELLAQVKRDCLMTLTSPSISGVVPEDVMRSPTSLISKLHLWHQPSHITVGDVFSRLWPSCRKEITRLAPCFSLNVLLTRSGKGTSTKQLVLLHLAKRCSASHFDGD